MDKIPWNVLFQLLDGIWKFDIPFSWFSLTLVTMHQSSTLTNEIIGYLSIVSYWCKKWKTNYITELSSFTYETTESYIEPGNVIHYADMTRIKFIDSWRTATIQAWISISNFLLKALLSKLYYTYDGKKPIYYISLQSGVYRSSASQFCHFLPFQETRMFYVRIN